MASSTSSTTTTTATTNDYATFVKCRNVGCGARRPASTIMAHMFVACEYLPMECKRGCGAIVRMRDMESHIASGCVAAVVRVPKPLPTRFVESTMMMPTDTATTDSTTFVTCRNPGCTVRLPAGDIRVHTFMGCEHIPISCRRGCGTRLPLREIEAHVAVCGVAPKSKRARATDDGGDDDEDLGAWRLGLVSGVWGWKCVKKTKGQ
jgi:hypothetical protein